MILSERFSKQDSDQCNDCLAKLLNLLYITMIESDSHKKNSAMAPIPCIESCFKDNTQVESFVHMLMSTVRVSAVAANRKPEPKGGGDCSTAPGRVAGYETVVNNAMRLLVACVLRARQMATYICTFGLSGIG